jgi:hypothetical protein
MTRNLTDAQKTEIDSDVVNPVLFVKIDYPDTLRTNTTVRDIKLQEGSDKENKFTYTGVGDAGSIDTIEETSRLKSSEVSLKLSGVPTGLVSNALSNEAQENTVKIWLGWLDNDFNLIDTPYQLFEGFVDNHEISMNGETSEITVNTVSIKRSLNKPEERRYTDQDQKNEFQNDNFFKNIADLQDKEVKWGG